MMRLFKTDTKPLSGKQEAVAQSIAERIITMQKSAADYLNAKTQGMSGSLWLLLLIGFCLAFGGYCLYLVVSAWR